MQNAEVVEMRKAYLKAVEEWVAAIREEEVLVSVDPSLAQVDLWEQAHFREENLRGTAKMAKKDYEAAIRSKYFNF